MKADIIKSGCSLEIIPFYEAEYRIPGDIPAGIYGFSNIPLFAADTAENLAFFRSLYPDDEIPGIIELAVDEPLPVPCGASVRIRKDTEFDRLLSRIPDGEGYLSEALAAMNFLSPALHRRYFARLEKKGLLERCRPVKGLETDLYSEDLKKSMEAYFGGLLLVDSDSLL